MAKEPNIPHGFPDDLEPTKDNIKNWQLDRKRAREELGTEDAHKENKDNAA